MISNQYPRPVPGFCGMSDVLYFALERQRVYERKAAGEPAPYTDDPIISRYRFCNIYRKNDRVSAWLLKHYYPRLKGDSFFHAAVARMINWPPTLQRLLDAGVVPNRAEDFNPRAFAQVIEEFKATGAKVYTGAYMLYAGGNTDSNKLIKSEFIATKQLAGVIAHKAAIEKERTVEGFVNAITACFGISPFNGGQIAADLTYFDSQLYGARDVNTWAPIGPGSSRGLARHYGLPLTHRWDQQQFASLLIDTRKYLLDAGFGDDLTLHDVQNTYCEFDKYMRVLNQEGQMRSVYKPETEYEV